MSKLNVIMLFLFLSIFAVTFGACDGEDTIPPEDMTIDETVFYNGKIYTVNTAQPWADAVYVNEGIIEYVGTNEEARNRASPEAEEIDLQGKFMMPGIHDVHLHPLEAASENFKFIVDDAVEDPEVYADDVADAATQHPGTGWLLGWGHWIDVPLAASRPPKEIIDEVAPDRPVAIMEQTSHSVWCNSKALELMGIDNNTPNPAGGVIMREANGEANGILIDNAGNMLLDLALTPTAESMQNDMDGLIEFALPELAKNGITSICDARTYWKRDHHKVWQKLAEDDKLTLRVNLGLWIYPAEGDVSQIESLKALYANDENSLLKINQIKLYSDGIVHNTTSAMHDDFLVDYFELPTNNGLNYITEERMANYIGALEGTGFDFHIHAIGNRGVHEALNAIEQKGTSAGRHRITHVEYIDPADLNRFAQLNVTADAQVAGDFTHPQHWHDNDYLIGATLNQSNIPLKYLQQADARITLSSDWDVSTLNPFVGMGNAVTRVPQNISLEEAVQAYTINSAYVMRQENIVGSIEVGKEADLIILNQNIFEIDPEKIKDTKVLKTYLVGEVIFE